MGGRRYPNCRRNSRTLRTAPDGTRSLAGQAMSSCDRRALDTGDGYASPTSHVVKNGRSVLWAAENADDVDRSLVDKIINQPIVEARHGPTA